MSLQKQPISLNFAQGLDTKTSPYQVQIGKFLSLTNGVFNKQGDLIKRNGNALITTLPNTNQTTLTTLNDNLIATGTDLFAFSSETNQWLDQGIVQPVSVATLPLIRVSTSQSSPDTAVASNGLVCLVYIDGGAAYYQISNSVTGQQIVGRTALGFTSNVASDPRVFNLGNYFIITFINTVGGVSSLKYLPIPVNSPSSIPGSSAALFTASATTTGAHGGYDGVIVNNTLYVAWAGAGTTIKIAQMSINLVISPVVSIAAHTATLMSVTADDSTPTAPTIWVTFYASTNAYTVQYDQTLAVVLTPVTQVITTTTTNEITSLASSGVMTLFYEVANNYGSPYPIGSVKTDFIESVTCSTAAAVGTPRVVVRSVGLASKAFIGPTGTYYMMATYGDINQDITVPSQDQNTYFLIDSIGNIYARIAYANGGGYAANQVLPSISINNGIYQLPYLIADFLTTVNKGTTSAGITTSSIYTQFGVNLLSLGINNSHQYSTEIASALHLTGGIFWEYDGVRPVEHGFNVWPDNVASATATTGGHIAGGSAGDVYYYQFTYEWTDNAGNLHRSAPSVPIKVDLSASGTSTNTNTLYVPTLRLTYKIAPNPVRIVGYRWSGNNQVYYQFTSVTSPYINDPTVDFITITDTSPDTGTSPVGIVGNAIIYTTGGVIEDICAPAAIASTLFDDRSWLIDAEDRNLLWFSKQVIENTPVEHSDLLTMYVAPSTGSQGSTGPMYCVAPMDDKLIIFKENAMYYINGTGPDNTGANSQYSQPVFITAAVGSANPSSIVLTPSGLMFQSNKGIWLLGRDLGTQYIGAPVEQYNGYTVLSAQCIPGTNQARFVLNNNVTLMFDYYYGQWGTFTNIDAISATLYQGMHTYLNGIGQVLQETADTWIDYSTPVLMSFTTAWINAAGIQGYQRIYQCSLLGQYFSPFTLNVQFSYDYNPSSAQSVIVTPNNNSLAWGDLSVWGAGVGWGNGTNVFTARVFPEKQKCSSMQLTVNELYNPALGIPAGEGITFSGLLLVCGIKKGVRTQSSQNSFG